MPFLTVQRNHSTGAPAVKQILFQCSTSGRSPSPYLREIVSKYSSTEGSLSGSNANESKPREKVIRPSGRRDPSPDISTSHVIVRSRKTTSGTVPVMRQPSTQSTLLFVALGCFGVAVVAGIALEFALRHEYAIGSSHGFVVLGWLFRYLCSSASWPALSFC
jgi:hypothetical protein